MYLSKRHWQLKGIIKSSRKGSKYDAVFMNRYTGKTKTLSFGAIKRNGTPYEQYRDVTKLALYKQYDHLDPERRKRYRARHKVYIKPGYYSPGSLSWAYLW